MTCFYPIRAYQPRYSCTDPNADRKLYFTAQSAGRDYTTLQVPCGRCIGCRKTKRATWAARMLCERQMHEACSFITLTYDEEHMPLDGSLHLSDLQKFYKRLRHTVPGVRNASCGEYGEQGGRPHYHSIVFGTDFAADRRHVRNSPMGDRLYSSETLLKVWGKGSVEIGTVTTESCMYVAGYVQKTRMEHAVEATRDRSEDVDWATGQIGDSRNAPEFFVMSRRPGIGASWFDQFHTDCFPSDFLVQDGKKVLVPPYFLDRLSKAVDLRKLEAVTAADIETLNLRDEVKGARFDRAVRNAANNTPERLAVREELARLAAKRLIRSYDRGAV